ncbi:MAG: hypothetical protein AAGC70_21110 [Pseudomonadota bacterium]
MRGLTPGVIPARVAGIYGATRAKVCGLMYPGDKHRNNIKVA